jgi:diguanylate cyclase (GGDEF)-like protein/PAS domain S-box-containing protein
MRSSSRSFRLVEFPPPGEADERAGDGPPAARPRVWASAAADLPQRLRAVSRSLTLATVLVAALALLGQLTGAVLPPLSQPITVSTGSAWILLLAGASLWLRDLDERGRWRRNSAIAAAIVVALAVVALTSDASRPPPYGYLPWNAARFLSAQSAMAFLLLGFSLLLIDWEMRNGVRPAQMLGLGVIVVSLAVMFGYLYGVPLLYRSDPQRTVPIQEAIVLFLVGTAVLCARPDRGLMQMMTSDTAGGILARAMPAAVLVVPAALGWAALAGYRLGWYDAPAATALLVLEFVLFFTLVIFRVARSLDGADRRRTHAEAQLRQRSLQRAGVAELGQRALSGAEPQGVREEAVRFVVSSLAALWGEFLELAADGATLSPTLGPDRGELVVEAGTVPARALASDRPVLIQDLPGDHRVRDPRLEAHGVASAAVVAVRSGGRTHGVLGVYSDRKGAFTDEDGLLLHTVASMLAAADDRRRGEEALRASEAKFSGLFRSTPDAIALVHPDDGRVLEVNDAFLQMTELLPDDIIGRPFDHPGSWLDPNHPAPALRRSAILRNAEIRFRTKSGEPRVGLCSTELVTVAGEPAMLAVIRDISERKREQEAIETANASLGRWVDELEGRSREISLLNELSELLHACVTTTEAGAVTTRFARELLPGTSGALCLFVDAAGQLEPMAAWGASSTSDASFSPQDCWALRRGRPHLVSNDGDAGLFCAHVPQPAGVPYLCVPMLALGEPLGVLHVHVRPAAGEGSAAPALDAVQRRVEAIAEAAALALANLRLRDRLQRQSIRDQVTGLFNRWYLEESLDRELVRSCRTKRSLGLILLDLDGFKAVNDTLGHGAGDELLRALGELFRTRLRASDFACRYGGDEFLLILPETTLKDAVARAEDIRNAVRAAKIRHRGKLIGPVGVSCGVVASPEHGSSVAELLKAADTALYRAKTTGRDRVRTAPAS